MIPILLFALLQDAGTVNWPSFRGTDAGGVATAVLPLEWNADPAAGPLKNIRWKTAIPGLAIPVPSSGEIDFLSRRPSARKARRL